VVPAAVVAPYSVLARPASSASELPAGEAPLLEQTLASHLASYDPTETRLVSASSTGSIYVVSGIARGLHVTSACRHRLSHRLLAAFKSLHALSGDGPAYCLVQIAGKPGQHTVLPFDCYSFAIAQGGYDFASFDDPAGNSATYGLVPDGVGVVKLSFAGRRPPIVGAVHNNVFVTASLSPTQPARGLLLSEQRLRRFFALSLPAAVTWLTAADGAIVRSIQRPPALVRTVARDAAALVPLLLSGSSTTQTCVGRAGPGGKRSQHCTTKTVPTSSSRS
jgi:hypothetical protein